MNPDEPVHIPAKMTAGIVLYGSFTLRHLAMIGTPVIAMALLMGMLGPAAAAIEKPSYLVGLILGLWLAYGKVNDIPVIRYIRIRVAHFRRPKEYTSNERKKTSKVPASRDFVRLAAIRNNIVITDAGGGRAIYAAIMEVTPRNFKQQRYQDRASSLAALYDVLVGSDKNLQLLVSSQPFDPTTYFKGFIRAIEKIPTKKFRNHSRKFLRWFEGFCLELGILERRYFILASTKGSLVPENADPRSDAVKNMQKTVRGLRSIVGNAQTRFAQSGAKVKQLNSAQCLRLIQDTLTPTPFTSESKLEDAAAKLDVAAEQKLTLTVPDIKIMRDFMRVGNDYVRTIQVREYPQQVGIAWLEEVMHMDERLVVSVHYEPKPDRVALAGLRKQSRNIRTNMVMKAGRDTTEEEIQLAQVRDQMTKVITKETKFMEMAVFIRLHAPTLRALDEASEKINYILRNMTIEPLIEPYTQEEAFLSTMPFGANTVRYYNQTVDGYGGTSTYPFLCSSIQHPAGSLLGFHHETGMPYIVDRWEYGNYTRLIIGMSGSGKSYLTKLDMLRMKIRHPDAWILGIDPLGEFRNVTKVLDGQVVDIGTPATIINPFDLDSSGVVIEDQGVKEANPLVRQLGFLSAFFRVCTESRLNLEEESLLNRMFVETYAAKGISNDPASWKRTPPTLADLMHTIRHASQHGDSYHIEVAKRLELYVATIMNTPIGFLNGQTNVKIASNMVMFCLEDLDEAFRRPFMFAMLDFIEKRLRSDVTRRKIVPIDEAWILLENKDTAAKVAQLSRFVRHVNCGFDIITQTADTFLHNPDARTVCTNSMQTLFFRQKSFNAELQELFGFDEGEAHFLQTMGQAEQGSTFSTAVFVSGQAKHRLTVCRSEDEHKLVTTKPSDLAKIAADEVAVRDAERAASEFAKQRQAQAEVVA